MEQLKPTLDQIVEATRGKFGITLEPSFDIDPVIKGPDGEWLDNPHYTEIVELEAFIKELRHNGVPERYLAVEWDDLEMVDPLPDIRAGCERIRDIIKAGHSLILCGPAGTGKTQAAMLIARAAVKQHCRVRVANVGRLASRIRAAYSDDSTTEEYETRELERADLLVLDDVGAGESGEAKVERRLLYFVLEARQNARRPTVVTTNLTATALKEFLGDRLMNRLMPAEVVNFKHGRNFRRPTAATLWAPGGAS